MPLTLKGALLQVLAYILWLVTAALCVVAVIELRSAVNVIWAALGGDRSTINLVNQVSLLLGGLAAFIYVLFLEGYYRESVQRGALGSELGSAALAQTQVLPPAGDLRRRSRNLTWQWLGVAGLSALMRRFAITIAIPLGVLALCLALREIALAYG